MSQKTEDVSKRPEMEYFMNEETSDVVFVIEGQRLPALKSLLWVKSRVFRAMFLGEFKESNDKEVVVKDTNFEAFKTYIQILYFDLLILKDVNDFQLIEEICKLLDRFDTLPILKKISDHLLSMELSHSDMTSLKAILKIAFDYKLEEVMANVIAFIDNNFSDFIVKPNEELVELNDLTNNQLFDVMANNQRKVNKELTEVKGQLARLEKMRCKDCQIINDKANKVTFSRYTSTIICLCCKKIIFI